MVLSGGAQVRGGGRGGEGRGWWASQVAGRGGGTEARRRALLSPPLPAPCDALAVVLRCCPEGPAVPQREKRKMYMFKVV